MPDYSVVFFAQQAQLMRHSQKNYFELIKKAKGTKLPADFEAAKKALEISKKCEVLFDEMVNGVLNQQ